MLGSLGAAAAATTAGPLHAAVDRDKRRLWLWSAHWEETAEIEYKRNGVFVESGLSEANRYLRDWRSHEVTGMDPALLDVLWTTQQTFGGAPITIVCGYRSPTTNAMLAAAHSGVARNSYHVRGMAVDFRLPGVGLSDIRDVGLDMSQGGVGYYLRSNFVHMDTGPVRSWNG